MDCTNCGDKCPYVQQGFCKSDCECPNYVESWWVEQQSGKQKLIKDCAPKRLMIDSQNSFNRGISIQASVEKLEFRLSKLESLLEMLIYQSKKFMLDQQVLQHEQPETQAQKVVLKLPENPRGER